MNAPPFYVADSSKMVPDCFKNTPDSLSGGERALSLCCVVASCVVWCGLVLPCLPWPLVLLCLVLCCEALSCYVLWLYFCLGIVSSCIVVLLLCALCFNQLRSTISESRNEIIYALNFNLTIFSTWCVCGNISTG